MRDNLPAPAPLVLLDAVSLRAGTTLILDGVSCAIAPGPPTAIIGPNGSGKTSLLRLLMGLTQPTSGRIEYGGASKGVTRAIVFQKPVMLRRTVQENIAFARTAAGKPRNDVAEASLLDLVGLSDLANRPARRLSGGEQQRLAIARALARQPELLLLDEATASLDPAQTKNIEDLIQSVAATGVKIVFATHDLGQARRLSGDVVLLVKGRLVEHAPTQAFFSQPASDAGQRFIAGELVL